MKATITWKEKILFDAQMGKHLIAMDGKAPVGSDQAPSPKELILAAVCGCTGMDVVSLLRKAREVPSLFAIEARAEFTEQHHPKIFSLVHLIYSIEGDVKPETFVDAVDKSMTLYCGVSAMIAKACPIHYELQLNQEIIGKGEANFPA